MNVLKRIFRENLPFVFACPALIWQIFFIYIPLFILFFQSLDFKLSSYVNLLTNIYFGVIANSFVLALFTATICLFVAYPVAYFLSMKVKKFKTFLLFSLILPSWTSFIVQVYAWIFLLQKNGPFSIILYKLGIISSSTHFLNNYFAIMVGMVYCYLPFMILPIYTVLEKMDKRLLEVSADLGADKFQTFKKVVLPLSSTGIVAGFLLVFIPAFGEFAVPDLLGGGKKVFWGSLIVDKFLMTRDWPSGAALAFIGILILLIFFVFFYFAYSFVIKFIKTKKIWGSYE
ncbi:ABC transporter permease [Candidatus Babeliales bacterium]|nr:ABC transporter permease [Candidatus Babeliales bacterium]MCF7899146.1 ABC transporter permease [Candidatus Babeliales bacterium]